ncbi:aldo/keto reductase [Bradyrhizobium sp. Ai1a-2]|uniref:aldo/keto reductase n=1 Tax=Bradyrhizobium sp. Ai1a-2 TaxID=196490 RepID=UPI001FCAC890|nr:aldo/keto reductase [Bradyrhizobium sp. Ai1a-2]
MSVKLPTTTLGEHGPVVGSQGFGCMAMATGYYGETDEAAARATLDRALDLGVTLFDTADVYGGGANEEFIAPFVQANRDRIVIATKFGLVHRDGKTWIDNRPEYIRQSLEGSLRRLGVDTIDLYYMHRRTPDVPMADSVGTMADLVREGKIRYLGLSEVSAAELREAHAIHPITALQTEWSLFSREVEAEIVPAAAEHGIALVPYSPLGRGQLSGATQGVQLQASDVRQHMARFSEENRAANDALIAGISNLASRHDSTPAQVALAWLHHQAAVHSLTIVPIPGTRKPSRVEENVGGATLRLADEDFDALDQLADAVRGDRSRTI